MKAMFLKTTDWNFQIYKTERKVRISSTKTSKIVPIFYKYCKILFLSVIFVFEVHLPTLVGGWTTHLKNILVKLDHVTRSKKYLKPPPSIFSY